MTGSGDDSAALLTMAGAFVASVLLLYSGFPRVRYFGLGSVIDIAGLVWLAL
jgi:hypothetical protein